MRGCLEVPKFAKTLFIIIELFVYQGIRKCGRELVNQLRTWELHPGTFQSPQAPTPKMIRKTGNWSCVGLEMASNGMPESAR